MVRQCQSESGLVFWRLVVLTNAPSKFCMRAHTHTQVMGRAHTRKLGAHINVSSTDVFAHISVTSFHMQINSGKMLRKRNFMRTETIKN